jgi:HemY protein
MKRLLLLLLIVLAVGTWIGEKMVQDPGYVLIEYSGTTIESTLWVLILALLLGFIVLYATVTMILRAKLPHTKLLEWRDRHRQKSAQRKTMKGLLAFYEGRWWQAQRLLKLSAEHSALPLVNYLTAARAAHEEGKETEADEILQEARNELPSADIAINLTQAQIQLERGDRESALANLVRLRRLAPNNATVMRLLKDVYIQLEDWQKLTDLLPKLRKQKVYRESTLNELEQTCYAQLLGSALSGIPAEADVDARLKALTHEWNNLPNHLSKDELMVRQYVELLIEARSDEKAEAFVHNKLKKEWDEGLARLYGRIQAKDAAKQYKVAQAWEAKHPESASLKLTLGRLAMRNEKWEGAAKYFEESLALEKSPETYSELSRLLQFMGETDRTLAVMQDGIAMMTTDLPRLLPSDAEQSEATPDSATATAETDKKA